MLNLHLPNVPSFKSLRPNEHDWGIANDDISASINERLGAGKLFKVQGVESDLARFYLHENNDGDKIFLKLTHQEDLDRYFDANIVASYLMENDIATSILLDGYPKELNKNTVLLGYKFIPYRFADITSVDIENIGSALGKMHKVLNNFSIKKSIFKRTQERICLLKERANIISQHENGSEKYRKLHELVSKEPRIWEILENKSGAQPTHGDLNYGNIIFSLSDENPILLDFEDAMISWFHPAFDIAQVLERFVLSADITSNEKLQLGRKLLGSYYSVNNIRYKNIYSISDYMRMLSVRALLTLAELESRNVKVDSNEWEKFFILYDDTFENKELLLSIEGGMDI